MALTMTRNRTQKALTKFAEMVANVHGELAFLEGLLAGVAPEQELGPDVRARLELRRAKLVADRDALYATVRQFDASIEPERIGSAEGWRKGFGRKSVSSRLLTERYLQPLFV
jgi:hypothetical protein